ncbi:uncharacterized protein EAE98_003692 [Botrytis deweyae]|uniref:Uncharacterized protein n=1 Tax=Botrytis deweyae TaxID=2478750 RepID=A0ABQ7IV20_9HELO|nr:uncharacterized protein EAE98_003692 [Botrytis deweyae]KAF7933983.1 hypothetical protein EAE98_003692 [Botrytis deweyae]
MGALSAVLAIPYRSIKESIERSRKQKNKNKKVNKQTISAPGSRTPSVYRETGGRTQRTERLEGRVSPEKGRSQSLGYLPSFETPRAELEADLGEGVNKGKGKGKEIEGASLQKLSTVLRTTSQRDFALDAITQVEVIA